MQTGPDVIIARSSDQLIPLPDGPQQVTWWQRIRAALSRRESAEEEEEVPLLEDGAPVDAAEE